MTDAAYSRSLTQTNSLRIRQGSLLTGNGMVAPGCRHASLVPSLPFARRIAATVQYRGNLVVTVASSHPLQLTTNGAALRANEDETSRRGGLGLHRAAAIGVQGELTGKYVVFRNGVIEQRSEQHGALCVSHTPTDHAAAEDVEDDVEIEVAPLRWSHKFRDVPGPDLIGPFGDEFRLPVGGMAELLAAFADFAVLAKDAVHGADRAVVDAFIEQAGVDLGRRLVCEARRMQQIQHNLLLRIAQCPARLRSLASDRRRRGQVGAAALHAGT